MNGATAATRLRDLADYAETVDDPVGFRTLRVELEALAKSLYRAAQDDAGGSSAGP